MEINQMLKRQEHFFQSQKTKKYEFRKKALLRLECAIKQHEEDMEHALYKDLGKSSFESYMAEIGMVKSELSYAKKYLKKWMKTEQVKTPLAQFPSQSYKIKEPLGKVLIIAPWNYPMLLSLQPLIGAIAAGNCCVLKPSEHAPHCASLLKKMIGEVFSSHYVAVINGGVEISEKLLEQSFDHIFYTGGERVGKIVMEKASRHLTPVTLELGGKSPVIIEKTANIKEAARRIAWGKLLNAGQTCVAPDYVLVDESRKQQFLTEMKTAFSHLYGKEIKENPDFGRIVNKQHMERLQNILDQDRDYLFYGGTTDFTQRYVEPTILDVGKLENSASSAAMQEEIFGPILPVLSYHRLEDAIRFVNKREKPLALYVFTRKKSAEKFILERVASGGVCVNDTISHLINPMLPFGGVGASGMGRYHGKYSFDTFTHEKSVFIKPANWNLPVCYPQFTKGKKKLVKFFLK